MADLQTIINQLVVENQRLKEENTILRQKIDISDHVEKVEKQTEPAGLNRLSDPDQKIRLFLSLFRGRTDVYARRWYSEKQEHGGYTPVCLNEWVEGVCDKKKYKCGKCPHRKLSELTTKAIYQHLSGRDKLARDVVGIYPMLPDETCFLLAIDFDDEDWQKDVAALREVCSEQGIIPAVERSRSGNGAHVWFFFEDKISCATARKFGSGLLTRAMEKYHTLTFQSYDRLFPNQDTMPTGGFGNLIALPMQGQARRNRNSVFIDDNFVPYADQWSYLFGMHKLKTEFVEKQIIELCKNGELGHLIDNTQTEGERPWEAKQSLPTLTSMDFPQRVRLIRANALYIDKKGVSQTALNQFKRLGAFKNPEFYKAQAMHLPTYNKSRIIDTTSETEQYLILPRGCEAPLLNLLDGKDIQYQLEDKSMVGHTISVEFKGKLYEQQLEAVETLISYNIGVLSATTGFGKTVIGAYLIANRKVNTLIIVHTQALLNQWKQSLAQFLDFDETLPELPKKRGRKKERSIVGQLGGSKNSLTGIVDVAVVQSLVSEDEVKPLVKDYGMVIVDECHHVPAFSFEQVLKEVNSKYVYGMTATPIRQDGHQPIIFMQCGPIRYCVDAKEQAKKHEFDHTVIPRFTNFRMSVAQDERTLSITDIYAALCENKTRNHFITDDVLHAVNKGRTPLILTERFSHAKILYELLYDSCPNVFLLTGKASAKEKRELLQKVRDVPENESMVIIATGKYVGEGFDEPRLDTLFLAMPFSWKGTLAQYAGRLHRAYDSKQEVIIYDYVDIHIPMLERMYHKRIPGYTSLGYKARASEAPEQKAGVIFDNNTFFPIFSQDITNARQEVIIVSPFIQKGRLIQMLKLMGTAQLNGIKIAVITRPPEDFSDNAKVKASELIAQMSEHGIHIVLKSKIHQKFAVIDQQKVWYGSMNLLSYGRSQESIMRFQSEEVASDLLESID